MASPMRTISLPSGDQIPVLGQGTWGLGESRARRSSEIAALRRGLDIGMNLIDTAEMYANGDAEILVGEAIAGRREEVFLVTKVWPHHATREGTVQACQGSLRRLNTGWIDLYLLHWRGPVPLAETLEAFSDLRNAGLIRNWGVSNFDVSDLDDLMSLPGSLHVATDQVLYNLAGGRRSSTCSRPAASSASRSWRTRRSSRGGFSATRCCVTSRPGSTPLRSRSRWPGCCAWTTSARFRDQAGRSTSTRIARPWRSTWIATRWPPWTRSSRLRCTPSRWKCSRRGPESPVSQSGDVDGGAAGTP